MEAHFLNLQIPHLGHREGRPSPKDTQESGCPRGVQLLVILFLEGLHSSGSPSGRSRPEPLLLPAPEGRPGGLAEEVSAAGRNASGRGAPAWGGGDSRAGGWGSRRGKAECARCLTSLWYPWTGRGAATMTTSRGSVGWTTGSAPSEKTQTVRARLEGALTRTGEPATRGPRSRRHLVRACTRRCGPTFFSLLRRHHSLAPPRRHNFPGPPAPTDRPPSPPQLLPCGPRAGAADVADRGGLASGAAWRVNSGESPSLALPCREHSCSRVPGPLHLL